MPDILKGDYAKGSFFQPGEENTKAKEAWFGKFPGAISSQAKPVGDVAKALKAKGYKVCGVGACWGYKVVVTSEAMPELSAVAGFHPAFPDVADAEKIDVPFCFLPSQGEDYKTCKALYDAVEAKHPGQNHFQYFSESIHGWMGARADLSDPEQRKTFGEGYTILANFFTAALAK